VRDVSQTLPRFNRQVERVRDAQRLGRILLEVEEDDGRPPMPVNGAGGGSPRRMRGVPIVGVRSAGGTSPGTDPMRALLARDGQRRRR
jgi:hypothetical protein